MVYWNIEYFQMLYKKFQSSGSTVRKFCKDQGINEARFYFWSKKLKEYVLQGIKQEDSFIPIKPKVLNYPVPAEPTPLKALPASTVSKTKEPLKGAMQISYPNGVTILLEKGASLETVRSLINLI